MPYQFDPNIINQAIPGLPNLTKSATNIIDSGLNGLPSPDEARLENAYYGAGSGLDPRSEFLQNRGVDLYKRKAEARQQQGLDNLLKLLSTYSGTVAPTTGQQIQSSQFDRTFNYNEDQDMLSRSDTLRAQDQARNANENTMFSRADRMGCIIIAPQPATKVR